MENWQPISTAPKTGDRLLLYRSSTVCTLHIVIGRWTEDARTLGHKAYWTHDAEHLLGIKEARRFQPTHWLPLPPEPPDSAVAMPHSIDALNHAGHSKRYRQR